ncbi:MAG: lysoplasmalogenase [Acutalibacteraceae bacterium]
MLYLPVISGAVFLVLFIIKCRNERSVSGVFLKNITSVFFVMTAAIGIFKNPTQWQYGIFILIGLVFGMLGDIYLDLKWVYPDDMKSYLNSGFIFFGFGHLFYIPAIFLTAGLGPKDMIIPLVAGVVIAVGNLLLEKPMKQDFGEFRFIVTVYGFILAFMAASAVVAAFKTGETAFIVYAIGAVSFMLSDLILSPMYFAKGKNTPINFILNHVTYYVGQYMIALSIALLPAIA